LILDLIEIDRHLPGARAALTGEGSLDGQSLRGKALIGSCRRDAAALLDTVSGRLARTGWIAAQVAQA